MRRTFSILAARKLDGLLDEHDGWFWIRSTVDYCVWIFLSAGLSEEKKLFLVNADQVILTPIDLFI
jgi:hypothetical protein